MQDPVSLSCQKTRHDVQEVESSAGTISHHEQPLVVPQLEQR